MNTPRKIGLTLLLLIGFSFPLFAESADMTATMTTLVVQLGIIIIAAHLGGRLAAKAGLPSVLGELGVGILLSAGLLGGLALPGYPQGLFPPSASGFAVSPELYGFATLASIILLFMSGLETDISLFKRYAAAGGAVGLGGVLASFLLGSLCGVVAFKWSWLDPRTLFLGILGTATSVGITARILSDQRKMDSPEGVTILAAAVIDDVLGIICLAVVLGIANVLSSGKGSVDWLKIGAIALKAFGIWAIFTVLGIVLSRRIARFLKRFRTPEAFTILALGLALLLAGFFEKEGLAMIIGAYIMGLSLSGTDLKLVIREKLQPLYIFFVPIFFTVMGMLVDVHELFSPAVLGFGLAYTAVSFLAKILGCGIPSLFFGFNPLGALRIGVGMVPRGEVALIIAGIGISGGYIDKQLFGIVVLMTLLTTVIPPPLLKLLLNIPKRGTTASPSGASSEILEVPIGEPALTELVVESMASQLKKEGFFVRLADPGSDIYVAASENSRISLRAEGESVYIEASPGDITLARTVAHETLIQLGDAFRKSSESLDTEGFKLDLVAEGLGASGKEAARLLDPSCVSIDLAARDYAGAIEELVGLLASSGKIEDAALASSDILAREEKGHTGLGRGIALPHGRSEATKRPLLALGISREGIDFGASDGEAARIIFLLISPREGDVPHLRIMASLAALFKAEDIQRLLSAKSAEEAIRILDPKHRALVAKAR